MPHAKARSVAERVYAMARRERQSEREAAPMYPTRHHALAMALPRGRTAPRDRAPARRAAGCTRGQNRNE